MVCRREPKRDNSRVSTFEAGEMRRQWQLPDYLATSGLPILITPPAPSQFPPNFILFITQPLLFFISYTHKYIYILHFAAIKTLFSIVFFSFFFLDILLSTSIMSYQITSLCKMSASPFSYTHERFVSSTAKQFVARIYLSGT